MRAIAIVLIDPKTEVTPERRVGETITDEDCGELEGRAYAEPIHHLES